MKPSKGSPVWDQRPSPGRPVRAEQESKRGLYSSSMSNRFGKVGKLVGLSKKSSSNSPPPVQPDPAPTPVAADPPVPAGTMAALPSSTQQALDMQLGTVQLAYSGGQWAAAGAEGSPHEVAALTQKNSVLGQENKRLTDENDALRGEVHLLKFKVRLPDGHDAPRSFPRWRPSVRALSERRTSGGRRATRTRADEHEHPALPGCPSPPSTVLPLLPICLRTQPEPNLSPPEPLLRPRAD